MVRWRRKECVTAEELHVAFASTFLKDRYFLLHLIILATTTAAASASACPLLRLITCVSYSYLAFLLLSLTTVPERRRERFAICMHQALYTVLFLSDSNIFEMGLKIYHFDYSPFLYLLVYIPLVLQFYSAAANFTVDFFKTPKTFSNSPTATFAFEVKDSNSGLFCSNCDIKCQLDNSSSTDCRSTQVTYNGLNDGNHTLTVCANASQGAICSIYNWTIDTTPPTAYVTSRSAFTNDSDVLVRILFSEPCSGGGGFVCNDSDCNLLVYGMGRVIPSTLKILQPALEYSLVVAVSADEEYGRLVLVMNKKTFCMDAAGNGFTRSFNSSYKLHYDRRAVTMNITTRVPEKPFELNGVVRRAIATNDDNYLKIYVEFSEPVLNSSREILPLLHTSSGTLVPTYRNQTLGNRRFGYLVNSTSRAAIVTVSCEASSIISRQETPVSSSDPLTFLYDVERPSVKLTTYQTRTTEHNIPVLIKFVKPVFDFNSSAIMVWGGQLLSFHKTSRSVYAIQVKALDKLVTIEVSENSTQDIAGNRNFASNLLEVRHYSIPVVSTVISFTTTILFLTTAATSGLLTVSTSSLISSGALSRPTSIVISEPTRSLLRIACHVQLFALTRWLTINLPIEYYEFARGIEWIIPQHKLPWESSTGDSLKGYSAFPASVYSQIIESSKMTSLPPIYESSLEGKPLTPMEYRSIFENQDLKPEAQLPMVSQKSDGWTYFGRNMFWLAVIGGGFVFLHMTFLLIFTIRKKKSQKQKHFGALIFPRFEIFLIVLSLPCICQASTAIIKGGTTVGLVVGIALIGIITSFLIALLIFLSIGITMGKVLQYKEVHQEGLKFHWYQEIIRRTLGPGKRGQWTWKSEQNAVCLTKLGPLFEDLRGPPKYMLSQIASGTTSRNMGKRADQIIASDDENEDAEAPFIQKLFGILRIYYTLLDTVKRVAIGIAAGAHSPGNTPSRAPTILVLSITSFQLFFIMLKKPFIKKKVQLVEIIAIASEVCIFAFCLVLLERDFTETRERIIGVAMLAVFAFMFAAQMMNEWYALYRQVKRLSQDKKSFYIGLKTALTGLLLIVLPLRLLDEMNCKITSSSNHDDQSDNATGFPTNYPERSHERSWLKQLREMAKDSFSRESMSAATPNDPSSSNNPFWGGKRSGSSSITSSMDSKAKGEQKAKSQGLYKDLENIFSSR